MHAGKQIAERRKALGLTQKELGVRIGYAGDPGRSVRKLEAREMLSPRLLLAADRALRDASLEGTLFDPENTPVRSS